jgi:hypothetical protein
MTTPKPKARKPFTIPLPIGNNLLSGYKNHRCIPLDAASVEALRMNLMFALNAHHGWCGQYVQSFSGDADAVLAALGIKRRKTK